MEERDLKKQIHVSGAVAMLMLVCAGLICVAGIQYFREMKGVSQQAAQNEDPRAVAKAPSWHLQLKNVPERKAFIGFKHDGQVYVDASELCLQPGFRTHADNEGLIEIKDQDGAALLLETPDIALPSQLANSIWWVVSSDSQSEERVFDMPYQWLTYPPNDACLFLGQKTGDRAPQKFQTDESEPVIGLMGFGAPLGLQLVAHEDSIEVTQSNRTAKLKEFPWLLSWLHKFSREGAEQCESSDGFMPTSKLLPIKVKTLSNDQQDTQWLVITGCEVAERWSLVITNEDGTASFITLTRPPNTDYYSPAKVWTADIDGDGTPEFLIKAQYYEGMSYVLLRLNKNSKGDYYLTEIAGTGATGRQSGQVSFSEAPYGDRNVRSRSWNVQLTQPLWRAAGWAALDQAGQQEVLAQAQFRQAEQELILRTAQAYLDVLVAREAERVARLQISAIEQQLGLARRNFQVGTGTVTDVHEAKSRYDLSRAQAVAAKSELENKRAELMRILGEPMERLARLRDEGRLPDLQPETALPWTDSAREQSLQVRIAQATLDVADREIAKSQAAHSPSLDLTAGYGNNFSSGSITSPADIPTRSRASQIGLNLTVPLYAGGGVQARVREALALKDKAEEDLEAARRQAVTQAQQAFTGVVNGAAQVEALASAIASSKSSLDANKIGFRIGTRINIDVLNAEQQLYAAQRDWHKARADTLVQGLRLKAANATLTETDLTAINDLLEPESP